MRDDFIPSLLLGLALGIGGLIVWLISTHNIMGGDWSFIVTIFYGALPFLVVIGVGVLMLGRRR